MQNPYPLYANQIYDLLKQEFPLFEKSIRSVLKTKGVSDHRNRTHDNFRNELIKEFICAGALLPLYVMFRTSQFRFQRFWDGFSRVLLPIAYGREISDDFMIKKRSEIELQIISCCVFKAGHDDYEIRIVQAKSDYIKAFSKTVWPFSFYFRRKKLDDVYSEYLASFQIMFVPIVNAFKSDLDTYWNSPHTIEPEELDYSEIISCIQSFWLQIEQALSVFYSGVTDDDDYNFDNDYNTEQLVNAHKMYPEEITIAISLVPWFILGIEHNLWSTEEKLDDNWTWNQSVFLPHFSQSEKQKAFNIISETFYQANSKDVEILFSHFYEQFRLWEKEYCFNSPNASNLDSCAFVNRLLRRNYRYLKDIIYSS